jgi:uncharacterized membrane protein
MELNFLVNSNNTNVIYIAALTIQFNFSLYVFYSTGKNINHRSSFQSIDISSDQNTSPLCLFGLSGISGTNGNGNVISFGPFISYFYLSGGLSTMSFVVNSGSTTLAYIQNTFTILLFTFLLYLFYSTLPYYATALVIFPTFLI